MAKPDRKAGLRKVKSKPAPPPPRDEDAGLLYDPLDDPVRIEVPMAIGTEIVLVDDAGVARLAVRLAAVEMNTNAPSVAVFKSPDYWAERVIERNMSGEIILDVSYDID